MLIIDLINNYDTLVRPIDMGRAMFQLDEGPNDTRRLCRRNYDLAFNSLSMIDWTPLQQCVHFKNIFEEDYFDLKPENCTLTVLMDDCVGWVQDWIDSHISFLSDSFFAF